ncbi:MAG: hypothetical protein [Microvirus sp.]|nr:MAG: hypothetical protein [Microvirus sp.]
MSSTDQLLERLSTVLVSLVPIPAAFVDPSTYQPGKGWVQIGDFPDLVERAGYRTIEQQVRELQAAGERLEDWRQAVYPDAIVNSLEAVPVFADELEVIERFRTLQARRADFKAAADSEAVATAEAKAAAEKPIEPMLVRIAPEPMAQESKPITP